MIQKYFSIIILGLVFFSCGSCNDNNDKKETEIPGEVSGDVTLYITTANRAYDFKKQAVNFSTTSNMSPNTITLDPTTRYQEMDGFGAAVTGSTCYNLLKMAPANRN
jgi:glucosylceramidase